MPPLTRRDGERHLQVMVANPAQRSHAVATSQQSGTSGMIPGTSSDPTQPATLTGTIQSYPDGSSPNGDSIAGVGHQVLNNAGNPVVVMGNLKATSGGGSSRLPTSFQDGGFSFVDAAGNQVAGYSQKSGLYGFGGVKVTDGTTTVNLATELDFTSGATVTDGGGGVAEIAVAPQYLFGVTAIYQGGFIVSPNGLGAPYPSGYFPTGIDYNQRPGQDHNTFGGSAAGTVLLVPNPPDYTNTNPFCLFYSGPTNPGLTGASPQLLFQAFTVGSGGYTVVAQGSASPTGWTYSPGGNIGPYTGLWMTYGSGGSPDSQLSWDWNITPTGPISYNSDGSFTLSGAVMVDMAAVWTGYMT